MDTVVSCSFLTNKSCHDIFHFFVEGILNIFDILSEWHPWKIKFCFSLAIFLFLFFFESLQHCSFFSFSLVLSCCFFCGGLSLCNSQSGSLSFCSFKFSLFLQPILFIFFILFFKNLHEISIVWSHRFIFIRIVLCYLADDIKVFLITYDVWKALSGVSAHLWHINFFSFTFHSFI